MPALGLLGRPVTGGDAVHGGDVGHHGGAAHDADVVRDACAVRPGDIVRAGGWAFDVLAGAGATGGGSRAADPPARPWWHLAHANGYPPLAYRGLAAALAARAPGGPVVGLRTRPMTAGAAAAASLASWHPLADDLVAALDALDAAAATGPVVGVGHSLGAVVTLYAAVARPDRFAAVVLIDPVFLAPEALSAVAGEGDDGPSPRAALVRGAVGRREAWADLDDVFAHFRPKPVFARFDDAALRDYAAAATRPIGPGEAVAGPDGAPVAGPDVAPVAGPPGAPAAGRTLTIPRAWEAQIYRTPPADVWAVLPHLAVPTLALRGAETDTLSPAAWARWQALQPSATFVELPGVGHLLPFEAPAPVAAAIARWVDG